MPWHYRGSDGSVRPKSAQHIDPPKCYFIYLPQHAASGHPTGTWCRSMSLSYNPIFFTSAMFDSHWEIKLFKMAALHELCVYFGWKVKRQMPSTVIWPKCSYFYTKSPICGPRVMVLGLVKLFPFFILKFLSWCVIFCSPLPVIVIFPPFLIDLILFTCPILALCLVCKRSRILLAPQFFFTSLLDLMTFSIKVKMIGRKCFTIRPQLVCCPHCYPVC